MNRGDFNYICAMLAACTFLLVFVLWTFTQG